jgi:hypothetical protein
MSPAPSKPVTSNRTIIGMALKQLGVTPLAGQPHVDHLDAGLAGMRAMFNRWVTIGTFGQLGTLCPTPETLPVYAPDLTVLRVTETDSTLLFDRFINGWWDLNDITLDGDAPLSERDPDGLACALAVEISATVAAPAPDDTRRRAQDFRNALAWKHGFERCPVEYSFS